MADVVDLYAIAQSRPTLSIAETRIGDRAAWLIPDPDPGADSTRIRGWILRAPGLYPEGMFDHFVLSTITLEPVEGYDEAFRITPDCTAELSVYGLQLREGQAIYMQPPEILVQVAGVTREQVRQLADTVLVAALTNRPPPIVDVVGAWHTALRAWLNNRGGRLELPQERRGRYRSDDGPPAFH